MNFNYKIYKFKDRDSSKEWVCDFTGTRKQAEIVAKQAFKNNGCYAVLVQEKRNPMGECYVVSLDKCFGKEWS